MTRFRCTLVAAMALALSVAMLNSAEAQRSGGRRGFMGTRGGSFVGLLANEKVRTELEVNEEQLGKLTEIGKKLREEMSGKFSALREIEDRQEQRSKMTELRDELDEKARGQIQEVLERKQMMRLYQIRLQVRGVVYGLNHEFVARILKLTDEQKKKVADVEKATQAKTAKLFSGLRELGQEERRAKFGELREKMGKIRSDAEASALEVLNDEQKEGFKKIQGEKVEL